MKIDQFAHIKDGNLFINGQKDTLVANIAEDLDTLLKAIYKTYEINYSKFHKMDKLSKLGFLLAEILLRNTNKEEYSPEEVGVLLCNSSSSLCTDAKYQKSIAEIPSPATFVYTLPNIVIGEICIKHKLCGENTFFVQEHFDADFFYSYAKYLYENCEQKMLLLGWVEVDMDTNYEAFMCSVSDRGITDFTAENLNTKKQSIK